MRVRAAGWIFGAEGMLTFAAAWPEPVLKCGADFILHPMCRPKPPDARSPTEECSVWRLPRLPRDGWGKRRPYFLVTMIDRSLR